MAASDEAIVLLVELVVIVAQVAHAYHAFALVLVDFHVDAPLGHARDDAFVHVSDAFAHKLYLLVLDRGAFGACGGLFHGGAMVAQFFVLVGLGGAPSGFVAGEEAVHHQVGITADGRGEMGVIVKRQAVVPDVMDGVAGFLHGAERYRLDEVLLFLARHVAEQAVERARHFGLASPRAYLVAEAGDELVQVFQLHRVGQVVDTVGEYFRLLVFGHFADVFRHGAVCQQHEFLYQLVGFFRLFEVHAQRLAFFVDFEFHFHAVEVDGACCHAPCAELLGEAVQFQYFVGIVARSGLDDGLRLFVGEAAVRLDDRVADAVILHFGVVVEGEDDRVGELFFIGAERADEVAQAFGKHRDGAVDQIYRGGALHGLLVDGAAFLHVVRHVGDMHAHFPQPRLQRADREGVVEVLGVLGVDGEGGHAAEVFTLGIVFGGDFRR